MTDRILLIRTGGTIDAESCADPRNPPPVVTTLKGEKSFVIRTVPTLPNHDLIDDFSWAGRQEDRFFKDSKEFTPQDLHSFAQIIKDHPHRYVVVTHGTDAMVKNASALQELLQGTDKVVVFTGSIVPLSMQDMHESDGVAALRFAFERVSNQSPGVYIAGRDAHSHRLAFFDPSTVEKDWKTSRANLQFTLKSRER